MGSQAAPVSQVVGEGQKMDISGHTFYGQKVGSGCNPFSGQDPPSPIIPSIKISSVLILHLHMEGVFQIVILIILSIPALPLPEDL